MEVDKFQKREKLFNTMTFRKNIVASNGKILLYNVPGKVDVKIRPMLLNRARYSSVARHFPNQYLRWYVVALIHEMEGEQNFNTYLGNGQSIHRTTTIVPKSRGPFINFEAGAIDALNIEGANGMDISTIGKLLYFLESFNGFGYVNKGINSPYIWSGSNQYERGKYVRDGVYDPNAVSQQIGIALLFKRLIELGAIP